VSEETSMMRRLASRARLRRGDDQGIAMIMVMASITVLTLLVTAALGYALQAQPQARHDQDWNAALAAAQAGIDDYLSRLNQNDSYWQSVDCANPAMKGAKTGTNSCGYTTSTTPGWLNLSSVTASRGAFHYDVDASAIYSQGVVRVTSTGKVNGVTRSVQVLVARGGATDFVYYTNFEDADPANTVVYPSGATTTCGGSGPTTASYWYPSYNRNGCQEITFVAGDTLDGRVHFNDTPLISGATKFVQGYETSDPACKTGVVSNDYSACWRGSGQPNLNGNAAVYSGPLNPPDNTNLFATYPGCQYTGDTRIVFNPDGTMTVTSVGSQGTTVGTGCGNSATFGTGAAQTINVPVDQVIYVKNGASQSKCKAGQVSNTGNANTNIPMGTNGTTTSDVNFSASTFYCGNGNAYVEGTLKGRVTLAAQNNIVVTGDILLVNTVAGATPTGPDMLGLVAANSVVVYHPVNSSGNDLMTINDRWIYASVQTLQHSFWVQSFDQGNKLGTLHVRGSIAQQWRGIVGTGGGSGTGFLKDYSYDTRLKFASPPYFPQWTNAVWAGKTTSELKPQY
jgi:Tfp pilus assembly protein PilX